MTDIRVKDHPDLVKRGAGVINKNFDDYQRALARSKQAKRIDELEDKITDMSSKLDLLIKALTPCAT